MVSGWGGGVKGFYTDSENSGAILPGAADSTEARWPLIRGELPWVWGCGEIPEVEFCSAV